MSKEIENLTEDIRSLGITVISGPPVDLSAPLAQHLGNLGYRKPRTITTKAELDALPENAVILSDEGGVFEHEHGWWRVTGSRDPMASSEVALPVTVLHEATL